MLHQADARGVGQRDPTAGCRPAITTLPQHVGQDGERELGREQQYAQPIEPAAGQPLPTASSGCSGICTSLHDVVDDQLADIERGDRQSARAAGSSSEKKVPATGWSHHTMTTNGRRVRSATNRSLNEPVPGSR